MRNKPIYHKLYVCFQVIVTNGVLMTDSRSPKCQMHKTIVEGLICCWNRMKQKNVVCRGFNMTNHYLDSFLCFGFIFYGELSSKKGTSYRVNEMFLSCTSDMKMSICCWSYKTIQLDIIWFPKECNKTTNLFSVSKFQ